MGFQGKDPCTDFRGMGLLALKVREGDGGRDGRGNMKRSEVSHIEREWVRFEGEDPCTDFRGMVAKGF